MATAISTNGQWDNFLKVMNMEYLHDDERFATNESRGRYYYTEDDNPEGLREILEKAFADMTKKQCDELFTPLNIPSGPGLTIEEAFQNEQLGIRNMVLDVNDKAIGIIKMMGVPIKISGVDDMDIESAPLFGEHTEEYIASVADSSSKERR